MAKKTAKKAAKKSSKKPAAKPSKAKKPVRASKAPASSKGPIVRRADLGAPVTTFFNKLPAEQKAIAEAAHEALLKAAPMLEHCVKWGLANYTFPGSSMKDADGFAIYASSKSVNLAVGRGGELAKRHPLLEGTGKSMRHIKLYTLAEANSGSVALLLADAVKLVSGR